MPIIRIKSLALLLLVTWLAGESHAQQPQQTEKTPAPAPWAKEMQEFAAADEKNPPRPGGIVFAGSSSIVRWDLAKLFEDLKPAPVNRGFGGSQVSDLLKNIDRAVLVHQPRVVVIYSGDNDVAAGKSAEQVMGDYRKVVEAIHAKLPETRVVVIGIKPSRARWQLADPMRQVNAGVSELCEEHELLEFVDVWQPMLAKDGSPRIELLADDGLHLSDEGYRLWTKLLRPVVERQYAEATKQPANEAE